MADEPSLFASRRALLAAGAASVASIPGCAALQSSPSMLDLTLFNQTETPYTVELSLHRVGSDKSRSEARAFEASIDVGPQGKTQRRGVAEARHYLVQYDLFRDDNRQTEQDHVHFYPTGGDGTDSLVFDIRSPGVLTRR